MIRVTVELVSAIDPSRDRLLGVATIANVGGGASSADYEATFSKWAPKHEQTWKKGSVSRFPRLTRGAWDLLYLALRSAVGDRNR